jgi:hypothetical protein
MHTQRPLQLQDFIFRIKLEHVQLTNSTPIAAKLELFKPSQRFSRQLNPST